MLIFRVCIILVMVTIIVVGSLTTRSSCSGATTTAFIASRHRRQASSSHWLFAARRRRRTRRTALLQSWTNEASSNDDDASINVIVGDGLFATSIRHVQSCTLLGGDEIRAIQVQQQQQVVVNGKTKTSAAAAHADTSAPAFAAFGAAATAGPSSMHNDDSSLMATMMLVQEPSRKGLEALVPGAFCIENAISAQDCDEMIQMFESLLVQVLASSSETATPQAAANNNMMIQIIVTPQAAQSLSQRICPWIDMETVNSMAAAVAASSLPPGSSEEAHAEEFDAVGMNPRWRLYKYTNDDDDSGGSVNAVAAPDIHVGGIPPCSLSRDGSTLIWNATRNNGNNHDNNDNNTVRYPSDAVSRYTAIIYLNDNFHGGHSEFYNYDDESGSSTTSTRMIAAIKPRQGSILLIPQLVVGSGGGDDTFALARQHWPLYKECSVQKGNCHGGGGSSKYIIQSDILFTQARNGLCDEEKEDPMWKNDEFVRSVFLPNSRVLSQYFLSQIKTLYNPQMGVENAGTFLYSFVRFTKVRRVVEIGAGYTTLWLLQALQDNNDELHRIGKLQDEKKCRLLDYPWTAEHIVNDYNYNTHNKKEQSSSSSSLLCIDNCLHQRETATGAGGIAKMLGLSHLLQFITGDAYDMKFEPQSMDLLWCDFGVGSKMTHFAAASWNSIKPGGFFICHSTITNKSTRDWLEAIRSKRGKDETGIPANEFVELSLLEPHKHYQNSITILQRRRHPEGVYEEPLYSEYA